MAIRFVSCFRPLLCTLGVWLALASAAAAQVPDYEQARQAYYRQALDKATRELILEEKLLTWRLSGIATELKRTGRSPGSLLDALLDRDPPGVAPEAYPVDSLAPFADRAELWIERQHEILTWKRERAIEMRAVLISTATPEGLEALFRQDLAGAIESYGAGDWAMARRQLADIHDAYPYGNMDDVLYYEAEAALADGAWDTAVDGYRELLRFHPDSPFRLPAMRHLLYVRSVFGQHAVAVDECREFADALAGAGDELTYLAGREFFLSERFAEGRRLLEGIPASDEYGIRAKHLIGLSLILDNRYADAIPVFEALVDLPRRRGFGDDPNESVREDARLKLGYLYFEEGRFAEASEMFEAVSRGSDRHAEALLGDAWSGLSLADHERAVELARELVEHYPNSSFRYEAQTLAGYASEKLERQADAENWYSQVLDEAERGEALRELAVERRQILQLMRQLVRLEREVFVDGRPESFPAYVAMRGEVQTLMRRVKVSELQTANESMKQFVDERREITKISKELHAIVRDGDAGGTAREREELAALNRQVRSLMNRIRLAGFVEIQRQPLMLYESTLTAADAMLDSLAMSSRVELGLLDREAERVTTRPGAPPREELVAALYRGRVEKLGSRVEQLRSEAAGLRRRPAGSNLSRWSELAFSRMAIGDIRFDELDRIEQRLQELDGYLEKIDELLQAPPATEPPAAQERP